MSKQDTIAMCFSETLQVDMYNKLIKLQQRNLETLEVMIQGQWVQLSNEQIQGDYKARSEIGMNYDWDDSEFQRAMALEASALALAAQYPMLYPLSAIYEHRKKVYLAAGVQDINKYLSPPPPGMEGWFPGIEMMGMGLMPPGAGGPGPGGLIPPPGPGARPDRMPGGPPQIGGAQLQPRGLPGQGRADDRDMAPGSSVNKQMSIGGA
jgi:hypothetical protein